ncbi:hypothetical protein VNO80_01270 [Phaseolus coccineus]|uniref:Uncharacterized protein n=1 Tax=Phaseolus coccineus TaxID=3886 RepID=A0AAN9RSK7_PHACN
MYKSRKRQRKCKQGIPMANPNAGKKISTNKVSNASNIPRRPPKRKDLGFATIVTAKLQSKESLRVLQNSARGPPKLTNFGFETIVNEKLASKESIQVQQKQSVGSLTLIQSISFAVFWLWRTVIGVLNGLKVRNQRRISPNKKTLVNEKLKTSSRKSGKRRHTR